MKPEIGVGMSYQFNDNGSAQIRRIEVEAFPLPSPRGTMGMRMKEATARKKNRASHRG